MGNLRRKVCIEISTSPMMILWMIFGESHVNRIAFATTPESMLAVVFFRLYSMLQKRQMRDAWVHRKKDKIRLLCRWRQLSADAILISAIYIIQANAARTIPAIDKPVWGYFLTRAIIPSISETRDGIVTITKNPRAVSSSSKSSADTPNEKTKEMIHNTKEVIANQELDEDATGCACW